MSIMSVSERYVEYFGPLSLPLFPRDMDDEEEIRFLPTLMSHPHFSFRFFFLCFNFLNRMFDFTISE